MKKNSNLTLGRQQISYLNATQEDVVVACDSVVAGDLDSESGIGKRDVGYQRLRQIFERAFPVVRKHPRKLTVDPNAKPKWKTLRVIFLPDVGKIDVADLVFIVEGDQQVAVSDRNISHRSFRRHGPCHGLVEVFLNSRAESDDLCYQFSLPVKNCCLRYVVSFGKNDTCQVVLRKCDGIVDLCVLDEFWYLGLVFLAAHI